ncbi:putative benzoate 4-monooxygenase cytochrome P450 [Jackrogersella minutella]|nr:putative benzoate 4-monooxygenase cytochrome P450 [Jackrogersella minutella]
MLLLSHLDFGLFSQDHASQAALVSTLLGVVFHLTILQIKNIEYSMYRILAAIPLTVFGLSVLCSRNGFPLPDVFTRVSILVVSFSVGLFSSMIIYRLFFHRLKRFRGPLDLKTSRLFSALRASRKVQYGKVVAGLHDEYGDFIRTGPRELCIVRKSAVATIYGPNSKCSKSTWYGHSDWESKKSAIVATRDPDDHRRRRKAWDRGLSTKAMQMYEPRIKSLAKKFISEASHRKGPLDGTDWSTYLAFDTMGEVGLGESFGCVASGTKHPAIKAIHDHMVFLGVMSHVPWLINLLKYFPGAKKGYQPFFDYCSSKMQEKWKNINLDKEPQDILSWLMKAIRDKDTSASPTKEALHEDGRVLIIAGSDTSATTLASALFYLAKNSSVQKKLQTKIGAAISNSEDWTYEEVTSITYLTNIITETLRLKPAVPVFLPRVTPREGIQVDEQFIPGDTNVFVPIKLIQTDPRYWEQASEFIPERFGERRDEMGTDEAPYMPWSCGAYACAGKPLAMMTLRIAILSIVQNFDISFAPGETGETFDKESKDFFTTGLSPLMLLFTPRK